MTRPNFHEDFTRSFAGKTASECNFGLVMAAALTVIALLPLVHGHPMRVWLLMVALLFLAAALLRPVLLRPLLGAWLWLGKQLQRVVSPVVLALVFALIFVPFGFITRAFGKTNIRKRPDARLATYWSDPVCAPDESMTRQF